MFIGLPFAVIVTVTTTPRFIKKVKEISTQSLCIDGENVNVEGASI